MEATKKANSIITQAISEETFEVTLRIPCRHIFTVLDNGTVELDYTKVSPVILAHAVWHGMGQRIPDSAAIGTNDKDGALIPKSVRTRIKYEKMNEVAAHYESGTEEWDRKSSGDGVGARSITIEAIARVKSCTYEEAIAKVDTHAAVHKIDRKKALAQLRNAKAVAEAILAIRAERNKVDDQSAAVADEMLDSI